MGTLDRKERPPLIIKNRELVATAMEKSEVRNDFFSLLQDSQVSCFPEPVDGGWGHKVPPDVSEEQRPQDEME